MSRQTVGLYADAQVYDILHAPGTARDVNALERIAARYAPRGARVWLEPGCGTGRLLRLAAARGRRVIGIDRNPEMLDYARRTLAARGLARRARFIAADMASFTRKLGRDRADFAFIPINTIRHLPGDRAMLAHFRCIERALKPRAVYAVGLTLTTYGMEFPSEDYWEGRRGSCRVQQIIQYVPPASKADGRSEQVHSHLIITRGGAPAEHRDSAYTLRCYSEAQWRSLVRRSPFRIAAVLDSRGRERPVGPSGYAVYVLRRKRERATRS